MRNCFSNVVLLWLLLARSLGSAGAMDSLASVTLLAGAGLQRTPCGCREEPWGHRLVQMMQRVELMRVALFNFGICVTSDHTEASTWAVQWLREASQDASRITFHKRRY